MKQRRFYHIVKVDSGGLQGVDTAVVSTLQPEGTWGWLTAGPLRTVRWWPWTWGPGLLDSEAQALTQQVRLPGFLAGPATLGRPRSCLWPVCDLDRSALAFSLCLLAVVWSWVNEFNPTNLPDSEIGCDSWRKTHFGDTRQEGDCH